MGRNVVGHTAPLSRRQFVRAGLAGAAGVAISGCSSGTEPTPPGPGPGIGNSRLQVKAKAPSAALLEPGLHSLNLQNFGTGVLRVPPAAAMGPVPLLLTMHGGAGHPSQAVALFAPIADEDGFAVLAVKSHAITWDAIGTAYGTDLDSIDLALEHAFSRVRVDAARVWIAGFSDGATYALGVGRGNGDLFRRIVAFSPGFLLPTTPISKPPVFVSHGTADQVLPIELAGRRVVAQLRDAGHDVEFEEFAGAHTVPPAIARAAATWLQT